MSFYTYAPVFCPKCQPTYRKVKVAGGFRSERVGPYLECTESCYSGCPVDHAECPQCERRFAVSYKVDEVTEI